MPYLDLVVQVVGSIQRKLRMASIARRMRESQSKVRLKTVSFDDRMLISNMPVHGSSLGRKIPNNMGRSMTSCSVWIVYRFGFYPTLRT